MIIPGLRIEDNIPSSTEEVPGNRSTHGVPTHTYKHFVGILGSNHTGV